jgi:hypothetical protein
MLLLLAFEAITRVPAIVDALPFAYPIAERARRANLYLALLDSGFLRLIFPPDAFSLAFSVGTLVGALCLALCVPAQVKAGRKGAASVMAVLWLLLVLLTFPLENYKFWHSAVKLVLLAVCPFVFSVLGARVFTSGEVAE